MRGMLPKKGFGLGLLVATKAGLPHAAMLRGPQPQTPFSLVWGHEKVSITKLLQRQED